MGSIYSTGLTPQRTILIECTPIVCIRCFKTTQVFTVIEFMKMIYILIILPPQEERHLLESPSGIYRARPTLLISASSCLACWAHRRA